MKIKNNLDPEHLPFTKMHGLGNDFVLINAIDQPFKVERPSIAKLANRHTGIGFDQLLVVGPSNRADFFCHIFNADGSEAEQCGNGLRCLARFLHEEKIIKTPSMTVETKAGIYSLMIHDVRDYGEIEIKMGMPQIEEALTSLKLPTQVIDVTIISVGNPHAIVKVPAIDSPSVIKLAEEIKAHPRFLLGTNIGLMEIVGPHQVRLRTFERGVGETQSCGSNACAAVVAGIKNGWLQNNVSVLLRYGSLTIKWENDIIHLTGPASRVFAGVLDVF
jgi:diaminopimelate epimerase